MNVPNHLRWCLLFLALFPATASIGQENSGKFRAHMLLSFSETRPTIMYPIPREKSYLNSKDTQDTLIRSSIVLYPALTQLQEQDLQTFRNQSDPMYWLASHLEVTFIGSELMEIAVQGDVKQDLIKILLAVRDSYFENVIQVEADLQMKQRAILESVRSNLQKLIPRKKIYLQNNSENPEAEFIELEIARMQKLYDQISERLEQEKVESQAPKRVSVILEPELTPPRVGPRNGDSGGSSTSVRSIFGIPR